MQVENSTRGNKLYGLKTGNEAVIRKQFPPLSAETLKKKILKTDY